MKLITDEYKFRVRFRNRIDGHYYTNTKHCPHCGTYCFDYPRPKRPYRGERRHSKIRRVGRLLKKMYN